MKDLLQSQKLKLWVSELREKQENRQNQLLRFYKLSKNALAVSFAFNAGSFLAAFYAVYYFADRYAGVKFYALLICGSGLLIFLELIKRWLNSEFWPGFFYRNERQKIGWGFILIAAVVLSAAVSFYGGERFVLEESAPPEVVRNAEIDRLNAEIDKAQNDAANTNRGRWYGELAFDKLTARIDRLTARRDKLADRDIITNDAVKDEHEQTNAELGVYFGATALSFDVLLCFCFFLYFRSERNGSLIAEALAGNGNENTTQTTTEPERETPTEPKTNAGTDNNNNVSGLENNDNGTEHPAESAKPNGTTAEPINMLARRCINCGTDLDALGKRKNARYCSDKCRRKQFDYRKTTV